MGAGAVLALLNLEVQGFPFPRGRVAPPEAPCHHHACRSSTRFKDYDKTPIGFGVALFCIAKQRAAPGPGPGPGGVAGGTGQGLPAQLPTPPPARPTGHGAAGNPGVAGTSGGGGGGGAAGSGVGGAGVTAIDPALLYQRFMDVFADWGEPNIPIDRGEAAGSRGLGWWGVGVEGWGLGAAGWGW